MGESTAESPHCGEDEDVEEERGREELQTDTEDGFLQPVELQSDNLLLISPSGRDKTQNLTSNRLSQSLSLIFTTATTLLLITVSSVRADPPVMRKLKPDCRCLGK